MARKPSASPCAPASGYAALVRAATENPFKFFSFEETREICGFGKNTMTALSALGAPVVARKCNPRLLLEWIGRNAEVIGKVRGDEDE